MTSISTPSLDEVSTAVAGKVIIITGAASGIGYATANLFADSGARVVIADLDEAAGIQASKEIGNGCVFIKCDVTSWTDQLHLFSKVYSETGPIDITICNAGIDPEIILAGDCTDEWIVHSRRQVKYNFLADELAGDGQLLKPPRTILDVNIEGVIYGIKLSTHFMKGTGGGRIIVIGSAASYVAVPDQAIYCASKHAALGLVRSTSHRTDMQSWRISICMVAPWLTTTPMTKGLAENLTAGSLASTTEDVAMGIAYMASKPKNEMNGKSIWVQGQTYTEVEDSISHHYGDFTMI